MSDEERAMLSTQTEHFMSLFNKTPQDPHGLGRGYARHLARWAVASFDEAEPETDPIQEEVFDIDLDASRCVRNAQWREVMRCAFGRDAGSAIVILSRFIDGYKRVAVIRNNRDRTITLVLEPARYR